MNHVGRQVKQLRLARGWSQEQLAVYAGSSHPTISQIESGKRNPSTATVQKLADALEVPVSELFPKAEAPSTSGQREAAGSGLTPVGSERQAIWNVHQTVGSERQAIWNVEAAQAVILAFFRRVEQGDADKGELARELEESLRRLIA